MTSIATPIHPTAAPRRDRPGPKLAIVGGSLAAVVALLLLAASAVSFWANDYSTNADGFHMSAAHTYHSSTRALATESLDIDTAVPGWLDAHLGTIRVDPKGDGAFVGVARTADVDAYLDQVAYDKITDLDYDPFMIETARRSGEGRPAMPGAQTFWVASSTGGRVLDWKVRKGEWTVVLMNEDASPGVDVKAKVGAKLPIFDGLGWVFVIGGAVIGIGGIALIVLGARASSRP